jgi:hypothetical protein
MAAQVRAKPDFHPNAGMNHAVSAGVTRSANLPALLVVASLAIPISACATATSGPGHGYDEPAILQTNDRSPDEITQIDGHPPRSSSSRIWPGRHRIEVKTSYTFCKGCSPSIVAHLPLAIGLPIALIQAMAEGETRAEPPFTIVSPPLAVCFFARPRHTYELRISAQLGAWKTEIIDHSTSFDVSSPCKDATVTPARSGASPTTPDEAPYAPAPPGSVSSSPGPGSTSDSPAPSIAPLQGQEPEVSPYLPEAAPALVPLPPPRTDPPGDAPPEDPQTATRPPFPPGDFDHDRFYLRLHLGPALLRASYPKAGGKRIYSSIGFTFGGALGYTVAHNLILFGEGQFTVISDPGPELWGGSDRIEGYNLLLTSMGPGLAYYWDPLGLLFSGALVFPRLDFIKRPRQDGPTYSGDAIVKTGFGVGADLLVGKEWWVSPDWGLGAALQLHVSSTKVEGEDARMTTTALSLLLSATFN